MKRYQTKVIIGRCRFCKKEMIAASDDKYIHLHGAMEFPLENGKYGLMCWFCWEKLNEMSFEDGVQFLREHGAKVVQNRFSYEVGYSDAMRGVKMEEVGE